jgi:predicted ribosomally synthesized peptide with SipW-like signal peptide
MTTTARRRQWRRRLLLPVALVLGLAAMTGAAFSLAFFTDRADIANNQFTTGTVDLSAGTTTTAITLDAMAPGDAVTNPLTVSNDGTLALRYAVTSAATNTDNKGLKDQLVLVIKAADVTTPSNPCDNFDGTTLYSADLDNAAPNQGRLIGDNTAGSQTGDRTLAAATSETLCFRISLPSNTGNAFQGAATTATFTFDAEQTRNNP